MLIKSSITHIWLNSQSFSLSQQTVSRNKELLGACTGHTEANTSLVVHQMDTIEDFNADSG